VREIQVVEKCDICTEAKPLYWDSKPITIEGTDYLVDACEFDVIESERTLARFFTLIQENSRETEESQARRKRSHRGKTKTPTTDIPEDQWLSCLHCDRKFPKQHGLTMHTTIKHPEHGKAA
jgi:hypothetical protein